MTQNLSIKKFRLLCKMKSGELNYIIKLASSYFEAEKLTFLDKNVVSIEDWSIVK
jgi:hypothetical protein